MEMSPVPPPPKRQLRLFLAAFVPLLALLVVGYFYFLRTEYSVLYADLRPEDASAIVAQLNEQNVPYELRDGGASILVPADQADAVRLAVAGSELPLKGLVGFELFNKSDMGLTDFAQKINYQRALQGELSRTIMMMDGIDSARVHLAIPERSLFRGKRSEPKAAVTVIPKRGRLIHETRVLGIQRLVAAAVSDLALEDVVVLDSLGQVISPAPGPELGLSPEMAEQTAVQQYYRARAKAAAASAVPGAAFDVRVTVQADGAAGESGASGWGGAPSAATSASAAAGSRNFRLQVGILSTAALSPEDQGLIRNAVVGGVPLDERAGDTLFFAVEPLGGGLAPVAAPAPAALPGASAGGHYPVALQRDQPGLYKWMAALLVLVGLGGLLASRSRRPALPKFEQEVLLERIRGQLSAEQPGSDAKV
jgi:flagellar M-ring protein FliF